MDGTFVTAENRARRGDILRVYVTGLGTLSPTIGTNQAGPLSPPVNTVFPVDVGINGAGMRVISARYSPNLIGVYEITFEVANDAPSGLAVPFAVSSTVGETRVFAYPTTIAIE
jgi:uncharacterized protein (TIGR03437 family)